MNMYFKKKGFTLIEIMFSILLLFFILSITTPIVSDVIARAELNSAHESLYNSILRAQNLSKIQYKNQQWRICIDNTNKQYVIAAGTCTTPLYPETIKISPNITISSSQTLDLQFTSPKGGLDYSGDFIKITLSSGDISKSILVNKNGTIDKIANFEPIDPYLNTTSLLMKFDGTNGSTTFIDSSKYERPVTRSGNPIISTAQSKFGGASGLFQNSSSVSVTDAPELEITEDFTIETWVYPLSTADIAVAGHTVQNVQLFRLNYGGVGKLYFYLNGQTFDIATNIPINQWTHLAISRQSGVTRIFVNGQQVGNSISTWTGSFKINMVGQSPYNGFNGYIDDFRVTKGVARYKCENYNNFYSSKFTVPGDPVQAITPPYISTPSPFTSSQDSNFDKVSLLLNMEGCEGDDKLIDSSNYNRQPLTDSNPSPPARINSSQKKFGFSSLFPNNGSITRYADAPELEMTGDFTIETWVYPLSTASSMAVAGHTVQNVQLFVLNYGGVSGRLFIFLGTTVFDISGTNIPINQWTHLAISRQNGVSRVFINGQQVGNSNSTWTGSFKINMVGGAYFGSQGFNGYIDDFRVTKGVARYINNFTPPGN